MATRSITIEINGAGDLEIKINDSADAVRRLENATEGASDGISGMGDRLKDFAADAAAVFTGGALLDGVGSFGEALASALDVEVVNDKLAAQLGAGSEMAAEFGTIAGDLYTSAYGDSIADASDALRAVWQQGLGSLFAEDASAEQIQGITAKVMDLTSAFDQELNPMVNAAAQLVRNGLAANAEEAFDILTRGFQQGVDASEDLLDTVKEYSTQFRDLGLTGTQALGLLSQGLKAGARDADTVADALKEFAIRAKDGSDSTAEGFRSIGLDAAKMAQVFAKGGPEAAAALDTVLDRLRAMPDPVKRSEAAIALFGTKAEDLQLALFALDPSTATAAMGEVAGAADRMGTTLNDNAATNLEMFRRSLQQSVVDFIGGTVLPKIVEFGERALPVFDLVRNAGALFVGSFTGAGGPAVGEWTGRIIELGAAARSLADTVLPVLRTAWDNAFGAVQAVIGWLGEHQEILSALKVELGVGLVIAVYALTSAMVPLVVEAYAFAAAMIAATWPLLLVGVAITGLVAGVIWAYNNFGFFRTAVDAVAQAALWLWNSALVPLGGWITGSLVPTIGTIIGKVVEFGGKIIEAGGKAWEFAGAVGGAVSAAIGFVANIARSIWDFAWGVGEAVGKVVSWFAGLPGRIGEAVGGIVSTLTAPFRTAFNAIANLWNNTVGRMSITMPDWLPVIGGNSFSAPKIPTFATGGIFHAPTPGGAGLAILHDQERVVPRGRALAATSPVLVNVYVSGYVGDQEELGRVIVRQLVAAQRQGQSMPWAS